MARSRHSPEQREAEILLVGRELLREVGHEKFLPAEVARRCDVSEGLVYRYFATRHDLLARVAVEWLGEILTEEPDLSGCVDLEQRLCAAVAYALHVVRAEPMLTRYVMLDLRTGPDYRGGALHQLNRRFTGIITEVLRDAIDTGELRPDLPVTLIRDMIFGAVEHQTWAYLRSERGSPPEQVAADIVAVLRHGIQAGVAVPG